MAEKIRATQCEMYWVGRGGGRCAEGGGRTERHHVILRSDTPKDCLACRGLTLVTNPVTHDHEPCPECFETGYRPRGLADICTTCHKRIHREVRDWLYRVELPNFQYAYVDAPSKAAVRKVLAMVQDAAAPGVATPELIIGTLLAQEWISERDGEVVVYRQYQSSSVPGGAELRRWKVGLLWSNVGESMERGADHLNEETKIGGEIVKAGAWRVGQAMYKLEQMGDAWQVLGYRTQGMFATARGFAPRTLRAYLAAERTIQESPQITQAQRQGIRELPIQLMIDARAPVSEMTTEQIDILLVKAETMPMLHLVQEAKKAAGVIAAQAEGKHSASVTLVSRAATFPVENVVYGKGESPVHKAKQQVEFRNPGAVIEWAPKGEQSWDRNEEDD